MCFSEKASFTAAGVLTLISLVSFYKVRNQKEKYALAAIPLLFALQQAAEGIEWLYFKQMWGSVKEMESARDLFLFIAYAVWPFWMPFSIWLAEKEPQRKKILEFILFAGIGLSFYLGSKVIFSSVSAYMEQSRIHYDVLVNDLFVLPYAAIVILPWFVSTLPNAKTVGVLSMVATLSSYVLYSMAFTSVWCFAEALIGIFILLVL